MRTNTWPIIWGLALLTIFFCYSCASNPGPNVSLPRAPAATEAVVQVFGVTAENRYHGGHGWIEGFTIHTAAHVVKDAQTIYWRWRGTKGRAKVLRLDEERDLATLAIEQQEVEGTKGEGGSVLSHLPYPLKVVKREPLPGEELWYVGFFDGEDGTLESWTSAVYVGRYIGTDDEGGYLIDGMAVDGVSGSPLISARGEVLGTLLSIGHMKTAVKSFRSESVGWEKLFDFVIHLSRYRPVVRGYPVY